MDGYELATEVRRSFEPQHRMLMIALTGYGCEQDNRREESAEFDAHLVKPLNPYDLVQPLNASDATA